MKTHSSSVLLWSLISAVVLPASVDAQSSPIPSDQRPGPAERVSPILSPRLPAAAWPTLAAPSITITQETRLPVYDDAGQIIRFQEIAARVDESGDRGAFWGGLVGAVVGSGLGALVSQCGGIRDGFEYFCSPRDEALRDRLPMALGVTIGLLGVLIGSDVDRTTFDEAISQIRYQRRVGR